MAASLQVMGLESVARAVPYVKDLDPVRGMIDRIDDSVDMRFVAMEKLFEKGILATRPPRPGIWSRLKMTSSRRLNQVDAAEDSAAWMYS